MSPSASGIASAAHEFAEHEIRPVAWEYDTHATWPQELIDRAWELGLMNAMLPAAYGGPGLSFYDTCMIAEELGWGCAGIANSLSANGLGMMPLLLGGSERLRDIYLRRLAEAPRLASFCLTEPDAGSDASAITTTARRQRRGWVIQGRKCFITNASHADWYTVFAGRGLAGSPPSSFLALQASEPKGASISSDSAHPTPRRSRFPTSGSRSTT